MLTFECLSLGARDMDSFLWAGSLLGLLLGLCHGVDLWRRQGGGRGVYAALWALVLWTLFGSYVLAFWILGLLLRGLARVLARRPAPGRS